MPLSVLATMRRGPSCSQNIRICGSERMIESAAARLRFSSVLSLRATCAVRRARPAATQASTTPNRAAAPMTAISGRCARQMSVTRSPPAAMPATSARTQARLAASRIASSRRMLPFLPLGPAGCIGIRWRTWEPEALRRNEQKTKARRRPPLKETNHGRLCGAGGGVARRPGTQTRPAAQFADECCPQDAGRGCDRDREARLSSGNGPPCRGPFDRRRCRPPARG